MSFSSYLLFLLFVNPVANNEPSDEVKVCAVLAKHDISLPISKEEYDELDDICINIDSLNPYIDRESSRMYSNSPVVTLYTDD